MSGNTHPPDETNHELHALRQRIGELEQSLHAAQRMLQCIIDNLPGAVFWKDRTSVYQGCNQLFATFAGVGEPANIVGKTDYDLPWKHEEADTFRRDDQHIMTTDQARYHIIEPQQHADGKQSWADTNKVPLHDANGNVVGILGTYEDITDRIEMQQALRRSEARFRTLIENSAIATWIHRNGQFLYVNPATAALLGYTAPELLAISVWAIIHPEYRAITQARASARQRGEEIQSRYEVKVLRKDGAERWVDMHASPVEYEGQPAILVTFLDITELKQGAEERARLQAAIIQSQAASLRELSTPLIPITDDVLAMPLIGRIDAARAQQIMETLLQGIAAQSTQVAILDITGVPVADAPVITALMQAAQAVRLLGAQVILTGIRPEVAQSLVELNISLEGIITRSTLQAGIAYAVGQTATPNTRRKG